LHDFPENLRSPLAKWLFLETQSDVLKAMILDPKSGASAIPPRRLWQWERKNTSFPAKLESFRQGRPVANCMY
jgi:hypothetical protein